MVLWARGRPAVLIGVIVLIILALISLVDNAEIAAGVSATVARTIVSKDKNATLRNSNSSKQRMMIGNANDTTTSPPFGVAVHEERLRSIEQNITKPRVVVMGPVKNGMRFLPSLYIMLQQFLPVMNITHYVFFENDSTDDTISTLKNHWGAVVESETNLSARFPQVISYARNRMWKMVQALPNQDEIDFVLSIDMDVVNTHLSNIEQCWLGLPSNWTVCCTNSFSIYYDLFALRGAWIGDKDCLKDMGLKERIRSFRHIPALDPPIPVDSCFGGAALYKYQPIRHLNLSVYESRTPENDYICEHVVFNAMLRKQLPNGQLYIQPKMMNVGKPRSGRVRQLNWPYVNASWHNPNASKWYAGMH